MKLELAQRELFYPVFIEPSSVVSGVDMRILRVSDGLWLDFDDGTFKNSGWATKTQALSEDDHGAWIWTTGWEIPVGPRKTYKVILETNSGFINEGPLIEVLPVIKFEAVTGTLSTTEVTTDLPSAVNDFYNTHIIQWVTGALTDQITDVTDYLGSSNKITVTAMTAAPSNGDEGLLI